LVLFETQINKRNIAKIRYFCGIEAQTTQFFLFLNSDFGLARYYENSYQPQSQTTIPVRWAAPEVLQQERMTSKSDVYSFGVCMWEILSKGKSTNPSLFLSLFLSFFLLFHFF
jgi:hypothetical protein